MIINVYKVLLLIIALILPSSKTFASCYISPLGDKPKYHKNFTNLDYVNPFAPKGGDIKFGVGGSFNSLNNFILNGNVASGLEYLNESLMTKTLDESLISYCLIASSVRVVNNSKEYFAEFTINPMARWRDGKPITADDIKFSFDSLKKVGHPSYRSHWRDIISTKVLNSLKVRFEFKLGSSYRMPSIAGAIPILPQHYYKKHDIAKTTLESPLGSGPYYIESLQAGRQITYRRDENYWGRFLPINVGRNNFDRIIFDYYRDDSLLLEAFKAGAFDVRQENIARNWQFAYNNKAVKDGKIIKKEIKSNLPAPLQAFFFNLRKPLLSDINLRHAIALTLDFDWMNQHLFYGLYKRSESYFPNSIFASDTVAEPRTRRDRLIAAQKLLTNANYKINDEKHLISPITHQPVKIEFLIAGDGASAERIIHPMIGNLTQIGIKAVIRKVDSSQYQRMTDNFDFDIVWSGMSYGFIPSIEQYGYWHSSLANIKGSGNIVGVKDPEIDRLVTIISKNSKKDEIISATKALDIHLRKNYYAILNWHSDKFRLAYWNKFAMPKHSPQFGLAIDSWWIKN